MKKLTFLFIISLILLPCVFAQDDDPFDEEVRTSFGIPDRKFEIGFSASVDVSNDFLSIGDILQSTLVLDIDRLADGFRMNLGANVRPFYFNINAGTWGFGLSTAVDAYGILNLSGEMLSFNVVSGEKSDVSGAVFASASINTFFHIERFKLKVSPSIFYAAAYATPGNITYTLANNSNGTSTIVLGYDMYVYTPFSMEKFKDGNFCLTGTPGFDVSVGLEYPLSRAIGITDVLPFLDMDVGLDFINIPIIASTLTDYMLVSGGVEKYDFNIFDEIEDLMKEFGNLDPDTEYGNASQALDRPFKMLAWLNWRPLLGSRLLTINPVVGFSVNHLYSDVFAFEGGINACLNLANLLRVSAGVNYLDRLWVNSIDIALNLRAIELNLGASLRSPDFLASWAAAGLGINLGLKIGW